MNKAIAVTKNIYFWGILWLTTAVLYGASISEEVYLQEWQKAIYIMQLIADILIGGLSFLAFITNRHSIDKKFYFLIFLSLIPGLLTNEIYNLLINAVGVKYIPVSLSKCWSVTYLMFLSIQLLAWSYLLIKNKMYLLGR